MKLDLTKIIIIIYIMFSTVSYSLENKSNNLEIGATLGIFTNNGFFLNYNLTDELLVKVSGYSIYPLKDGDTYLYEARFSLAYIFLNKKTYNLYFTASVFKAKSKGGYYFITTSDAYRNDVVLKGYGTGIGLKKRISELINFIAELQVIRVKVNDYRWHILPNLNFGFSFDL